MHLRFTCLTEFYRQNLMKQNLFQFTKALLTNKSSASMLHTGAFYIIMIRQELPITLTNFNYYHLYIHNFLLLLFTNYLCFHDGF